MVIGVEPGETPQQALVRELAEECGIAGAGVGELLVRVVERRPAREPGMVFSMLSEYFLTSPDSPVGSVATALGGYETALRLTPAWVDPDQAWRANRHLLGRWTPERVTAELPWLPRETRVLREVAALYR